MSLNRACSLATTPSPAFSRLSSNIGSPAQTSQLSRTFTVPSCQQYTSHPTTPARHSAQFRHAIDVGMKPLRPFSTASNPRLSEHGEYPESCFAKRYGARLEASQKPDKSSALSSALLTSSEIPRYTNSFGELGVIVSHSGWWSTRGRKDSGFSQRLAFDKDLVTALLGPSPDCLKVAKIAQGALYNVDKWPNEEEVKRLALAVEWVNNEAEIEVLRSNGGEKVVGKKALAKKIVLDKVVVNKLVVNKLVANEVVANKVVTKRIMANEGRGQGTGEVLELWEDGAAMVVS